VRGGGFAVASETVARVAGKSGPAQGSGGPPRCARCCSIAV
jgi:hypothetical protein